MTATVPRIRTERARLYALGRAHGARWAQAQGIRLADLVAVAPGSDDPYVLGVADAVWPVLYPGADAPWPDALVAAWARVPLRRRAAMGTVWVWAHRWRRTPGSFLPPPRTGRGA